MRNKIVSNLNYKRIFLTISILSVLIISIYGYMEIIKKNINMDMSVINKKTFIENLDKEVTIEDILKENTIIFFAKNFLCNSCRNKLVTIQKAENNYKGKEKYNFYIVSEEYPENNEKMKNELDISFNIISDIDGVIEKSIGKDLGDGYIYIDKNKNVNDSNFDANSNEVLIEKYFK